jgi:DNA replication protein DnaC
VEAVQGRPRL